MCNSERMHMVRLLFPLIWWLFFKWMLLNSYKIQRRGENLNKSQHLSLEPTPNISSSQVFCHPPKEGFNQHILILRILLGTHISETVMGTKNFQKFFKWTKCFALQLFFFFFSKNRGFGKVNKERAILSFLITINAELALLWSCFLNDIQSGNSS